jgi:hypothetical protein
MTEPVPAGERADLQQTARDTERIAREQGEHMGRTDTIVAGHDKHLTEINGSVKALAGSVAEIEKLQAVMTSILDGINRTLDNKVVAMDARLTVCEAWIAEHRGGRDASDRRKGFSFQARLAWWAFLGAFVIALVSAFFALGTALIVLYANGTL